MFCITLVISILCEECTTGHKVNAAAYHITSGESRAIFLPKRLATKGVAIIPVPSPAVRLPSWQLFQRYFRTRESNTDRPSKCQYPNTLIYLICFLRILSLRQDGHFIVIYAPLGRHRMIRSGSTSLMFMQLGPSSEIHLQTIVTNCHGLNFVCFCPLGG